MRKVEPLESKESSEDILNELAENPIIPGDEINYCRFCGTSWAESDWQEFLANHETLLKNPEARKETGLRSRLSFSHHNNDCLWVRCNLILRGVE
jgi:hypothetical protein